jgi:hypothetical protein
MGSPTISGAFFLVHSGAVKGEPHGRPSPRKSVPVAPDVTLSVEKRDGDPDAAPFGG